MKKIYKDKANLDSICANVMYAERRARYHNVWIKLQRPIRQECEVTLIADDELSQIGENVGNRIMDTNWGF